MWNNLEHPRGRSRSQGLSLRRPLTCPLKCTKIPVTINMIPVDPSLHFSHVWGPIFVQLNLGKVFEAVWFG